MLRKSLGSRLIRRSLSSKPFYITTPIFYPNAAPHLGHLYSMLLCDVRNRWELLKGNSSFFTTGTDEHGLKIQTAAEKQGVDPKEFVDQLALVFKDLASKTDIKFDRFIRTTDADHVKAVEHFWNKLQENGYIYQGKHSGWYSISDETFYPKTQILKNEENGRHYSIESGSEVVYTTEKNYFFKLSFFQQALIQLIESNPKFIIPEQRQTDLLRELKSGPLQDLSISRPSTRLKWGITVPNDDSQKIYVWVDALVNYLTSGGYPNVNKLWPGTHLIGKDIIRFHCIYWPALLLAAGESLPTQVVVHGHWLANGFKMSKSRGNVVDPLLINDYYGTDSLRFFLCENSVLNGDCNFSEEALFRTREQLIDKYSNLIMRCCGKKFNIERAVSRYNHLSDLKFQDDNLQLQYENLVHSANSIYRKMDSKITQMNFAGAIQEFWTLIIQANQFVQTSEPWKKSQDEQDKIIFIGSEVARICSILIHPVIPELSLLILKRLNISKVSTDYLEIGADLSYGKGVNRPGDHPIQKLKFRLAK
ncbi:hypothetical protein WICMUC_000706 [Wickerhamomyces mucosus]|uniref:Probable methionine--tRNA ligase, mitochondrial n=1 Tax=Wickerhamomyces mucosus TaxID=1378264 RepID=A0A9P8PWY5_9ASCO|nr:hypothetical protein WICMUC_000706 [Wickerhamomyces mucosus]